MNGYWMRPQFVRSKADGGGNLIIGPLQLNWYGPGARLHVTWPTSRTIRLWR